MYSCCFKLIQNYSLKNSKPAGGVKEDVHSQGDSSQSLNQSTSFKVLYQPPKLLTAKLRLIWQQPLRPANGSTAVACWPGVADGSDGVAELAVDAAAVVELLVSVAGWALVLDAADAADSHDEDDEHEDEGHAQRANDDVERVARHVGQRVVSGVRRVPLQVCWHKRMSVTQQQQSYIH